MPLIGIGRQTGAATTCGFAERIGYAEVNYSRLRGTGAALLAPWPGEALLSVEKPERPCL